MAPPALPAQGVRIPFVRRGIGAEVLEKLSFIDIPAPIEPGVPEFGGQLGQGVPVAGLAGHQGLVVGDQGLNKGVVLGIFPGAEVPVHKQPLEIAVGGAPGVQGVVGPFGVGIGSPDAGVNLPQPGLRHLPGLVGEPNVVLRPLILGQIPFAVAVAKPDGGAVGEGEHLFGFVVLDGIAQQGGQGDDVVVGQGPVGAAGDQTLDAGIPGAEEHRLGPDEPGFAPAPGPAVGHIAAARQ